MGWWKKSNTVEMGDDSLDALTFPLIDLAQKLEETGKPKPSLTEFLQCLDATLKRSGEQYLSRAPGEGLVVGITLKGKALPQAGAPCSQEVQATLTSMLERLRLAYQQPFNRNPTLAEALANFSAVLPSPPRPVFRDAPALVDGDLAELT